MLLLTNCEIHTTEFSYCSFDIWIKRNKVIQKNEVPGIFSME